MLDRWVVTVRGDMERACPIALLDLRRAMSRMISTSRPVSPSAPGPLGRTGGRTSSSWNCMRARPEFFLGAQRDKHVVHVAKLAERPLAVAQIGESAR